MKGDFAKGWKIYLKVYLNRRIIHFLDLHFTDNNIHSPSLKDIASIEDTFIERSWLSVPSCAELMQFQTKLKKEGYAE